MTDIVKQLGPAAEKLYGLNLAQAEIHYATKNIVAVFPEKRALRIHPGQPEETDVQELRFMSDCAAACAAVCGPLPSLLGNRMESVQVDDQTYSLTLLRKAEGKVINGRELSRAHAVQLGDILGHLHTVGASGDYRAASIEEIDAPFLRVLHTPTADAFLSHAQQERLLEIHQAVYALPREDGVTWGLLHGDLTSFNYYVKGGQVSVFDFNDFCYGLYAYDFAVLLTDWLTKVDAQGSAAQCYNLFLHGLREGYERHRRLPEAAWDCIPLLIQYRKAQSVLRLILRSQEKAGALTKATGGLQAIEEEIAPLMVDDVFEGIDYVNQIRYQKLQMTISLLKNGPDETDPKSMAMWRMLQSEDMKPMVQAILSSMK